MFDCSLRLKTVRTNKSSGSPLIWIKADYPEDDMLVVQVMIVLEQLKSRRKMAVYRSGKKVKVATLLAQWALVLPSWS